MELSDYEQKRGEDRQLYVKIECKVCGTEKWARWSRVRDGQGLFCSLECANIGQKKGKDRKYVGKENGKVSFDKIRQAYSVYWYDPETLQRKTTSYAHWFWEVHNGIIPDGYRVSYKDGNYLNIDPSNLILISPQEYGATMSEIQRGKVISEETKKKMSEARQGMTLSASHKENIGKATKKRWEEGAFDTPEIREAYSKQGKATIGSKRTGEQRKKMSEVKKGRSLSVNAYSPEAVEKRRQKLLGRTNTEESNRKRSVAQKGKEFSDKHLKNLSVAVRKRVENGTHNWYRGGVTSDPYPIEFGDYLRGKIRRRDNHECQSCGENVYRSKRGHVHHINGNKQDCSENNLLLLCATCHNAVHSRNTITSSKIEELKAKLVY